MPARFIEADTSAGQQLTAHTTHMNAALLHSAVTQSEMFSCAIATLGSVLCIGECEAFELICESLPEMQIQSGKQDVVPSVLEPKFNPRESALWVPGVLDVCNFTICVRRAGVVAEGFFGYACGAQEEEPEGVTCERFRASCRQLSNGVAVAVSFDRKANGQTGGGHWSPVAAYDEESDMVLVLDTAQR
eukprot:TRINITY_DN8647_c0_g1_i5.p1 TRINITY_DN8647_c0_g1~~TRINITY_DN8647_c0_g1_i5.p1  ORF type:complete len:189 (-),score=50.17 TRINITY_DN8647_c0_g1_i5:429-995(-)